MTLDEPIDDKSVIKLIENVFENRNTSNLSVVLQPGSSVGEGFLGVSCAATVKFDNGIEEIFVKMAPQDKQVRKTLFTEDVFAEECYFYSSVLPTLEDTFRRHTSKPLDLTPKCFQASAKSEFIVLENIKKRGFELSALEYFDEAHLLLMLKSYSKLHAAGFILQKENENKFKSIKANNRSMCYKLSRHFGMDNLLNHYMEITRKYCSQIEDTIILDKLDEIENFMVEALRNPADCENYFTILHIDCWRNNLMVRYNAEHVPQDIRLLDFQIYSINSPVLDISHAFYSNASSLENLNNINFYLDYYYKNLSDNIASMNGDPELLYPKEIFRAHWRKFCGHGLAMAVVAIRNLYTKPHEAPNIVEAIKLKKPNASLFLYPIAAEEDYCKRLKMLLRHIIQNNYV